VQIKLPLTHRTLATLVGCQRPSATIALRKLSQAGLLVRESRNCIVLTRKAIAGLREPESLVLMHEGLALS
jgi:Mn-dependent DtxR family transcriptional regulator